MQHAGRRSDSVLEVIQTNRSLRMSDKRAWSYIVQIIAGSTDDELERLETDEHSLGSYVRLLPYRA